MSTATPLLSATKVRKRFGELVVLNGIDVSLGEGDAVGIVGPNGAGKTTLLNILSGSDRPDAGSVVFRGQDITRWGAARRCRVGIGRAHQIPRPFGDMSVFENVFVGAATGAGLRRQDAYRRCIEVLEVCGLIELANRPAESLGLLYRKRLELARALATEPAVLLLDEIAAGLTDQEATELVATIGALRERGITIVWIEHIVHVLVQVVVRLIAMDAGRVIAAGDPEQVMKDAVVIDAYLGSAAA